MQDVPGRDPALARWPGKILLSAYSLAVAKLSACSSNSLRIEAALPYGLVQPEDNLH